MNLNGDHLAIMFCIGFLMGAFLNQIIHDMIKRVMQDKKIWPYNGEGEK